MRYEIEYYYRWYKRNFLNKKVTVYPETDKILDCVEFIERNKNRNQYPILKKDNYLKV